MPLSGASVADAVCDDRSDGTGGTGTKKRRTPEGSARGILWFTDDDMTPVACLAAENRWSATSDRARQRVRVREREGESAGRRENAIWVDKESTTSEREERERETEKRKMVRDSDRE
jgi:hypothetical protein